jgi:hypothetical protein
MKNNEHNFDKDPNLPFDENGKNPFGMPSDYFASFEDKLKKKMESENELSDFPLLSSTQKINSFKIPTNYFSKSENAIEQATELANYPELQSFQKPVFADLEADYIQQLNASIQDKVELVDELKAYSTLYALSKVHSFVVAENYFEVLPLRVKERIHVTRKPKASAIETVLDFIFGKKLALSFGLAAIICVSIYFYQSSKKGIELNNCQTLACLEKQDILNDKSINNFDDDQLMDLVNVKSLDKQLKFEVLPTDSLQQEEFILDNVNTDQLLEEL